MSVEQSVDRGSRSTRRKPADHKPHIPWRGLEPRDAAVGRRRLTARAIASLVQSESDVGGGGYVALRQVYLQFVLIKNNHLFI
jgi:hypothetical protein